MGIEIGTVVHVFPTKVWIEDGMMGERVVMIQHEGCDAFEYAVFNYNYMYTSNSGTYDAAENMARSLGAVDPIEHKNRMMPRFSIEEVRKEIALLNKVLVEMEKAEKED